jgi:hypothetical protein
MNEAHPKGYTLPPELDPETRSNAIHLTGRQWLGVAIFSVLLVVGAPSLWQHVEKLDVEPDYRIPKDLSNDYWLYSRYAGQAAAAYDTLVIGDSVIWGEYVTRGQTLSHYLNELAGQQRFANLGIDGGDPVSLAGLVEFYAGVVKGKKVVLLCNPLWMSSARRDLQEPEAQLNHSHLIPQFDRRIACYPLRREKISERIGVAVEQRVPFESWTTHLQQAYYRDADGTPLDIPNWTLKHPYENPLRPLTAGLPPSDYRLHAEPITWKARGIPAQDYPWIDLDKSLQWESFRRMVDILRGRGNDVFVLLGPFNEHLLTPASCDAYQKRKATIESWFREKQVPYLAPLPLATNLYADASHPLAPGYEALTREVYKSLATSGR